MLVLLMRILCLLGQLGLLLVCMLRLLLFFLVPIAGWAHSSAAGFPVVWFGIIHLPDLVGPDKQLAETLTDVHAALAYTMAGLVALHVAGALQHRFILKDNIVQRMLPGSRPQGNGEGRA